MPNLTKHLNPGRLLIATIGTGAMLAVLASAAVATSAPGATASASASARESASASQSATATVAGSTFKLPTGAALVARCRVIEDVNGVDKDAWKAPSADKNGDADDMTMAPLASASAKASATATESARPTESATPSATPTSSASPIVLGNGTASERAMAALDAACDKVMSKDKDEARDAKVSASPSASNKADPDDRNGSNGDDRNGEDGRSGHGDTHQGGDHSDD